MLSPHDSTAPTHADLAGAIAALEQRVAALEVQLGLTTADTAARPPVDSAAAEPELARTATTGPRLPSLGRAVLVLAGAFLLRALTDTRVLTGTLGVALGLGYAIAIILLADRNVRHGNRAEAGLLSLAAVLVVYPFLWETTAKLGLMRPHAAVAALVGVTALGIFTTVRHGLLGVAWTFVIAALITTAGLCWLSPAPVLFGGAAVVLGIGTLWLAYLRGWRGPRWPAAVLANLLVLLLAALATHQGDPLPGRPQPGMTATLMLAFSLPATYLASFFGRTLHRRHEAGIFEILQSFGCLFAGVLAAVLVLVARGGSLAGMGWTAVAVGAASYAIAFAFVRRLQGRGLNFFYYAWLGFVLSLTGTAFVVPPPAIPYLSGSAGDRHRRDRRSPRSLDPAPACRRLLAGSLGVHRTAARRGEHVHGPRRSLLASSARAGSRGVVARAARLRHPGGDAARSPAARLGTIAALPPRRAGPRRRRQSARPGAGHRLARPGAGT